MEGDGFVLKIHDYNKASENRMKDIYSGIVEVWQETSYTHIPRDWYTIIGRYCKPSE